MAYTPNPANNEFIANLPGNIRAVNTKVDNVSTELDSHISNINNPHNTTASQLGAALANHIHTASVITSTATSDVSATNVQAAIAELASEKAPKLSPVFTGIPLAPTASEGTSTSQLATTAFVSNAVEKGGKGVPIGTIFQAVRTDVPEGCLRLDGTEYTRAACPDFYDNFLIVGKLITCTYTQWSSESTANNGNVGKIGLDTTNQKFRLPRLADRTFVAQALTTGQFGKYNKDQIVNITGITGAARDDHTSEPSGAFYVAPNSSGNEAGDGNSWRYNICFDASRVVNTGDQVQPRHIQYPYFMVISNEPEYTTVRYSKAEADDTFVKKTDIINIPTKTSDLINDSDFIVSDDLTWDDINGKINASGTVDGLMTSAQFTKLAGIEANANKYVLPSSLPSSMITGLANVATSGNYHDLSNKPAEYTLPVATASRLGGVKQGSNVTIAADGTISASGGITTETDPIFTASPASGITTSNITSWNNKQEVLTAGANISIVNNVISATASGEIPAASTSVLGGIKVGSNVTISNGVLSADVAKSTTEITTLLASGWSGRNYVYTNANITATSVVELLPATNITFTQLEILQGANIIGGSQTTGGITLKAMGDTPTIDIPVQFIIRGDI